MGKRSLRAFVVLMFVLSSLLAVGGIVVAQDSSASILDNLVNAGNFRTLTSAIEQKGLGELFSGDGNEYTFFAPNDGAFQALSVADRIKLYRDPETLVQTIQNFTVPGIVSAADLTDGATFTTLNGATLTVTREGNTILVNGAEVAVPDLAASNGVIHAINSVIPLEGAVAASEEEATEETAAEGEAEEAAAEATPEPTEEATEEAAAEATPEPTEEAAEEAAEEAVEEAAAEATPEATEEAAEEATEEAAAEATPEATEEAVEEAVEEAAAEATPEATEEAAEEATEEAAAEATPEATEEAAEEATEEAAAEATPEPTEEAVEEAVEAADAEATEEAVEEAAATDASAEEAAATSEETAEAPEELPATGAEANTLALVVVAVLTIALLGAVTFVGRRRA